MSEARAVFGDIYAGHYDALYAAKDYAAECDALEAAFRRFRGRAPIESVLDLGCGTGNHALLLAQRGYRVTGVDRSAAMLGRAAAKAAEARLAIPLIEGDLMTVAAGGPFDAAICLFSVLGYLTETADLRVAFANIRRHLRPGGLFLWDAWSGPAVLTAGLSDRLRVTDTPGGRILRATESRLDTRRHRCDVHWRLWRFHAGRLLEEVEEVHRVRYFFPLEIELLLDLAGFDLLSLTAFPDLDRPLTDNDWYAFVVARARAMAG